MALISWRQAFSIYARPSVLGMIFLGFSAGLPFLLIFSTLSAWLTDMRVTHSVIGYFSWVGMAYSIKVFWAPVVDQFSLPLLTKWLGKRRAWLLLSQVGIIGGLFGIAEFGAANQLEWMALIAIWVGICSATQDIVIDAYRIEVAEPQYQGAMAATYVFGYRVALLVAGAGALYLADMSDWRFAYRAMAWAMLSGVLMTLWMKEPVHRVNLRQQKIASAYTSGAGFGAWVVALGARLADAVVGPFVEFFVRNGRRAGLILALIGVYKLSDITMGVMANPFYLDLGFTKTEVAEVSKVFGFFMTIAGASLGGMLVVKWGVMRSLLLGAILVASTNLLFAVLAASKPHLAMLAAVVSADNLSGGIAASVFIAYLSGLTNTAYTATQYALFSSLMTLPAKVIGGFSGDIVDLFGYQAFFVYASAIGTPAIFLVLWLIKGGEVVATRRS